MGITFGDHLIDSGYHEMTADQEMEREYAEDGMAWWNALDDEGRKYWMCMAGDTGRAIDAWRAFQPFETWKMS